MTAHSNYWFDSPFVTKFSVGLPKETDLIIIGGGIAGISLLYELITRTKFNIVLLESSTISYRNSGRCAGQIISKNDITQANNNRLFDLIKTEQIDCDFCHAGGFRLFSDLKSKSFDFNENELADAINTKFFPCGLFEPSDANINPYKFVVNLASKCESLGKHIITNADVKSVKKQNEKFFVEIKNRGIIQCKNVVYCNSIYIRDLLSLGKILKPVRHQLMITEALPLRTANLLTDFNLLFNDYFIRTHNSRILFGGLESELTTPYDGEINPALFGDHKKTLYKIFPFLESNIQYVWSQISSNTKDGWPLVGHLKNGEYLNVGFNHMGINLVFYAAKLMCDLLVLGKSELKSDLFNPSRFNI